MMGYMKQLLAMVVFICAMGCNTANKAEFTPSTPDTTVLPTLEQPSETWRYYNTVDEMREDSTFWASITSNEIKDFGFPYRNVSQNISIYREKNSGSKVMITLSEGQYQCYNGCIMSVKFDSGSVEDYYITATEAGKDVLWVPSPNKFIKKLKKSSYVKISTHIYDEGYPVFTFNTKDLRWSVK
jgi:hypothetical protein